MNLQQSFANCAIEIYKSDENLIGLAVAGSWLTNELDEFSDLDLALITRSKIGGNREKMLEYARQLPHFISGFTGEHVGEPRVLICLYDHPLLHVDIKFLTLQEFRHQIEMPVILFDRQNQLKTVLAGVEPKFPYPDYQWIEDRFWTWVHYALLKIGRGEYLEAYDFFAYLRMAVFGPLLHIKNGNLPRGVRKVETQLRTSDLESLLSTLPVYTNKSLLHSLDNSIILYRELRAELYTSEIKLQSLAEEKVMEYLNFINNR